MLVFSCGICAVFPTNNSKKWEHKFSHDKNCALKISGTVFSKVRILISGAVFPKVSSCIYSQAWTTKWKTKVI